MFEKKRKKDEVGLNKSGKNEFSVGKESFLPTYAFSPPRILPLLPFPLLFPRFSFFFVLPSQFHQFICLINSQEKKIKDLRLHNFSSSLNLEKKFLFSQSLINLF
jgi:hypothetical protein